MWYPQVSDDTSNVCILCLCSVHMAYIPNIDSLSFTYVHLLVDVIVK